MSVRRQIPDYVARYQRAQRNREKILKAEAEDLQQWAVARSPEQTGNFKESWEPAITKHSFTLINTASRKGKSYGRFVRRAGEDETVQREVSAELRRRTPRIAQRLQKNLIDTLGGA